ncbi:MAG: family 43 glycosylhydrolase [Lachnoclostridium sp.]
MIYSDVPDMDVIRVGDTYYMASTTMHLSPGVPIMKSKDLVNWEIVNYVYDVLDEGDALSLRNGQNAYGKGSWASSLKYYDGNSICHLCLIQQERHISIQQMILRMVCGLTLK